MTNLAWAAGQAVAAAGSGALAQATSDVVPCSLLAAACLVTLVVIYPSRARRARRGGTGHGEEQANPGTAAMS